MALGPSPRVLHLRMTRVRSTPSANRTARRAGADFEREPDGRDCGGTLRGASDRRKVARQWSSSPRRKTACCELPARTPHTQPPPQHVRLAELRPGASTGGALLLATMSLARLSLPEFPSRRKIVHRLCSASLAHTRPPNPAITPLLKRQGRHRHSPGALCARSPQCGSAP